MRSKGQVVKLLMMSLLSDAIRVDSHGAGIADGRLCRFDLGNCMRNTESSTEMQSGT